MDIVLALLAFRKPRDETIMNVSGLRGGSNGYRGNGIGNGDGNGNSSNHNHISNPLPFWLNHRKKLASALAFGTSHHLRRCRPRGNPWSGWALQKRIRMEKDGGHE